jgi:hypothetical protein
MELEKKTGMLSPTASKFGGIPYVEAGESWPQCPTCGKPLSFICQADLRQTAYRPACGACFFTFFYCWECFPWSSDVVGQSVVRLYREPDERRAVLLPLPGEVPQTAQCLISFVEDVSLPDWEGTSLWCPEASDLACRLDEEWPWETYHDAATAIVGEQEITSRVGGYPRWIQNEDTPPGMDFLAQIDSEDEAGIMWGDVGSVYLFLSPDEPFRTALVLQCC